MNAVEAKGATLALTVRLSTRCVSMAAYCLHGSCVRRAVLLCSMLLLLMTLIVACDHGLAPPDSPESGVIIARVSYVNHPEAWPSSDSLHDLRFVAMRFVPTDTADFLQLNRMSYSDRLRMNVAAETTSVQGVEAGPFFYSGVAQKFGEDPFAWRPVGVVEADDGVFIVRSGETTYVDVAVDFRNPPVFPPPHLVGSGGTKERKRR